MEKKTHFGKSVEVINLSIEWGTVHCTKACIFCSLISMDEKSHTDDEKNFDHKFLMILDLDLIKRQSGANLIIIWNFHVKCNWGNCLLTRTAQREEVILKLDMRIFAWKKNLQLFFFSTDTWTRICVLSIVFFWDEVPCTRDILNKSSVFFNCCLTTFLGSLQIFFYSSLPKYEH